MKVGLFLGVTLESRSTNESNPHTRQDRSRKAASQSEPIETTPNTFLYRSPVEFHVPAAKQIEHIPLPCNHHAFPVCRRFVGPLLEKAIITGTCQLRTPPLVEAVDVLETQHIGSADVQVSVDHAINSQTR